MIRRNVTSVLCRRVHVNDVIVDVDGVRVRGMSRAFISCLRESCGSPPCSGTACSRLHSDVLMLIGHTRA